MRKFYFLPSVAAIVASMMMYTSCTNEAELIPEVNKQPEQKALTRAVDNGTGYTITFEDVDQAYMAGPTSYGENLYAAYEGSKFISCTDTETELVFGINENYGYNYWNGGFAISDWNNLTNGSYLNQCSAYSGIGGDKKGGYNGSSKFAVAFGYSDFFNGNSNIYCANLHFENTKTEKQISGMWVCNSTYTYLVMENGNEFTTGGLPLKDQPTSKHYFKLIATGYDSSNNVTGTSEIYLADFDGNSDLKGIREGWAYFDLSNLKSVNKIVFNFEGSDSGQYGLNTPAYVCVDNIEVAK